MPLLSSLLLVFLLAAPGLYIRADTAARPQATAKTVKVAYIYNLISFVEWNATMESGDSQNPIIIGVLGSDPVALELDEICSRLARGRPIRVIHLAGPETIPACHILYIGVSENARLSEILPKADDKGVLTVSDLPEFAKRGGMVGFLTERERVLIEINLPRTKAAGLKISARLLEVARLYPRPKS